MNFFKNNPNVDLVEELIPQLDSLYDELNHEESRSNPDENDIKEIKSKISIREKTIELLLSGKAN